MVKRKGSRRFKPVKVWRGRGLSSRLQTIYIKNNVRYTFKTDDGANLTVYARTKNEAVKQAKSWERNLPKRTKYHTKVNFNAPIMKEDSTGRETIRLKPAKRRK